MNREQAKFILQAYRPGGQDSTDPRFAEALDQLQRDPELARWFNEQSACDRAIADRLRQATVPPTELRGNILAAVRMTNRPTSMPVRRWIGIAAAILVLAAGALVFLSQRSNSQFESFEQDMVAFVEANRPLLTFRSGRLEEINAWLRENEGNGNVSPPPALRERRAFGCRVIVWKRHSVSLLCFEGTNKEKVHLFVVDARELARSIPQGKIRQTQIAGHAIASWRSGDTVYMVEVEGSPGTVQRYL